ncbi:MAG: hypothetical protein AAGA65_29985, partial [Actinomycetota bacterium]
VSIQLEYERSSSSIGRLSVLFDDPLAAPEVPAYHSSFDDSGDTGAFAEVIDLRPIRPAQSPDVEVS